MSPSTALLSACGCGEKVYVDYNWRVMCTHSGILQESTLVDPSSDMCSIFYPGEIVLENASCYRVIALHTRRSVCVLPNNVLPGKPRARAHARKS